jgi:hypothetical protein
VTIYLNVPFTFVTPCHRYLLLACSSAREGSCHQLEGNLYSGIQNRKQMNITQTYTFQLKIFIFIFIFIKSDIRARNQNNSVLGKPKYSTDLGDAAIPLDVAEKSLWTFFGHTNVSCRGDEMETDATRGCNYYEDERTLDHRGSGKRISFHLRWLPKYFLRMSPFLMIALL